MAIILSKTDQTVLFLIEYRQSLNQRQIGRLLELDSGNVSRSIMKLLKLQFIDKLTDKEPVEYYSLKNVIGDEQ